MEVRRNTITGWGHRQPAKEAAIAVGEAEQEELGSQWR
jgi:hypothetical protein